MPLPLHPAVLRQPTSQPTSFIGRQAELAELAALVDDPACRLVSLVGPGGIGKTRLAIEVAGRLRSRFADGAVFVPLEAVGATDVFAAIAEAAGCPLSGQLDPLAQLLAFLGHRSCLLVLDNAEHLLDSLTFLGDLLAAAPGVRLLVTSRVVLNLREEWRYPLAGLALPVREQAEQWYVSDAACLFVERARQAGQDLALDDQHDAIVQICQLVEGLPLALELAAAWTTTLTCEAIAAEIARNLALLSTTLRNVPARHQSMRATFAHSWALLTVHEQGVFKRLAVFRDGFARDAAAAVARASLPDLAALVAKSLLRAGADGRYRLHELLRQYAEEHLRDSQAEAAATYQAHTDHYSAFLAARAEAMDGGDQLAATAAIATELGNIRAACQRAALPDDLATVPSATHALTRYYQFRGPYLEGIVLLEQIVANVRGLAPAQAVSGALLSVLVDLARLYARVGKLARARAALEESLALQNDLVGPLPHRAAEPLLGLAGAASSEGDYETAARYAETLLQRAEGTSRGDNLTGAWYILANVGLARGEYEAARGAADRAYQLARSSGDRWFMASCLNQLGQTAIALGDFDAARRHYEASYIVREEFGDPEGMAVALAHLGQVTLRQHDYASARAFYERSCAIYRDIGDRGGLARALHGLGLTVLGLGATHEAARCFAEALRLSDDIRFVPLTLAILLNVGTVLLPTGQADLGRELLAFCAQHPASIRETRERAQHLLAGLEPPVRLDEFATGDQPPPADALTHLVARAQLALAGPLTPACVEVSTAGHAPRATARVGASAAAEPLTEREREILGLIGDGLANKEIARQLVLTLGTVKWYTQQIYGKLAVQSRTQALARARELHLLP
jgi:predicted ATPase/DNA-binding CsgD family transcriptional regulator